MVGFDLLHLADPAVHLFCQLLLMQIDNEPDDESDGNFPKDRPEDSADSPISRNPADSERGDRHHDAADSHMDQPLNQKVR